MPDKVMRYSAPAKPTNPPGATKSSLRQPMALDGKRLNEKKPKKPKPTYSNTLNNYESIRNMVMYPSDTAAQEASTGKKQVSIGI